MKPKYQHWILNEGPETPDKARGNCGYYSGQMAVQFPELRRTAGYYRCLMGGSSEHWWCVDPDGEIVDPTAIQFPSKGEGEYVEIPEEERPIGKCMNCGEMVYRGAPDSCICSVECEEEFHAYLKAQ